MVYSYLPLYVRSSSFSFVDDEMNLRSQLSHCRYDRFATNFSFSKAARRCAPKRIDFLR